MRISFFSTQRYERSIFDQVNQLYHHNYQAANGVRSCFVLARFTLKKQNLLVYVNKNIGDLKCL
ncbi:hypothetical protein A6J40_17235 [Legionella longbeachae]|nr:hypothetical protein A6J40_17235 [Legionella longbeachae]EEZ94120.1 hypothetical protein LLB_3020 [Legionella longbeachae D-4968]